jgi:purine-nucleoside phosphorylase
MIKEIENAVDYIRSKTKETYPVGIILGTGLGGLVKDIRIEQEIDYSHIPDFPVSTVESHKGKLIFGTLSDVKIVAMQGRFHFYEGYSHKRVTFPVRIMKQLGVKYLMVSNACGAINPAFKRTDVMIITSHINLHFTTPLIGAKAKGNNAASHFYSKELIRLAEKTALENNIDIQKGVYASVQGPNLETPAEYRAVRRFTADTIGMSTIPEVIVAHKLGIKSLGVSIITDEGFPDNLKVAYLNDILQAASIAEPKMTLLLKKIVEKLKPEL